MCESSPKRLIQLLKIQAFSSAQLKWKALFLMV